MVCPTTWVIGLVSCGPMAVISSSVRLPSQGGEDSNEELLDTLMDRQAHGRPSTQVKMEFPTDTLSR